jgi:DNA replication protein DnaC
MSSIDRMLPQLKNLRLSGILDSLDVRNQQAIEQKMSYGEFLALILGDEHERRENKKLQQRMRKANFQGRRTLDNYDFDAPRLQINRRWQVPLDGSDRAESLSARVRGDGCVLLQAVRATEGEPGRWNLR